MSYSYEETISKLIKFRESKNWNEYHSLINLSRALGIESSEVEKIFLWKSKDDDLSNEDKENLKMELADVLTYAYYMCDKLNVDPNELVIKKNDVNQHRSWDFSKK
ncbi:MazG-like family protein [Companilactobacillus keshanensis]|uniref:MazG-like family protein n=1 Tax=Companilactobacillus keshanensis TaxID=2486003 RepID=A0ABW4BT62_9LACO|nr:MazG-like family protein [Companilactobacillus keshanensis]